MAVEHDERHPLIRFCSGCGREVPVRVEVRADSIHVTCSEWHAYDLPRFDPAA